MRLAAAIGIIGATAIAIAAPLRSEPVVERDRNTAFLEKEIVLAGRPGLYAVIDFGRRVVDIKARGASLKSWDIAGFKVWGKPVGLRTVKVVKRSALFPPKRTNITPEAGKEGGDVELDILELSKMPAHYAVVFEEGMRVKIRPRTKNVFRWARNVGSGIIWYAFLPIKTVAGTIFRKPFTEVVIVVRSEKDAKGIYWAFFDGLNCLFINQ